MYTPEHFQLFVWLWDLSVILKKSGLSWSGLSDFPFISSCYILHDWCITRHPILAKILELVTFAIYQRWEWNRLVSCFWNYVCNIPEMGMKSSCFLLLELRLQYARDGNEIVLFPAFGTTFAICQRWEWNRLVSCFWNYVCNIPEMGMKSSFFPAHQCGH